MISKIIHEFLSISKQSNIKTPYFASIWRSSYEYEGHVSTVTFQCRCEGEKKMGQKHEEANHDVKVLVNLEDSVCCDGESLVSSPCGVIT